MEEVTVMAVVLMMLAVAVVVLLLLLLLLMMMILPAKIFRYWAYGHAKMMCAKLLAKSSFCKFSLRLHRSSAHERKEIAFPVLPQKFGRILCLAEVNACPAWILKCIAGTGPWEAIWSTKAFTRMWGMHEEEQEMQPDTMCHVILCLARIYWPTQRRCSPTTCAISFCVCQGSIGQHKGHATLYLSIHAVCVCAWVCAWFCGWVWVWMWVRSCVTDSQSPCC